MPLCVFSMPLCSGDAAPPSIPSILLIEGRRILFSLPCLAHTHLPCLTPWVWGCSLRQEREESMIMISPSPTPCPYPTTTTFPTTLPLLFFCLPPLPAHPLPCLPSPAHAMSSCSAVVVFDPLFGQDGWWEVRHVFPFPTAYLALCLPLTTLPPHYLYSHTCAFPAFVFGALTPPLLFV